MGLQLKFTYDADNISADNMTPCSSGERISTLLPENRNIQTITREKFMRLSAENNGDDTIKR